MSEEQLPKVEPVKIAGSGKAKSVLDKFKEIFKEILGALTSVDAGRRRMARIFLLSLVGTMVVTTFAAKYYLHLMAQKREQERILLEIAAAKQKEEELAAKHKNSRYLKSITLELGSFVAQLLPEPTEKDIGKFSNTLEFEVVVECDLPETCALLKGNMDKVRDQINLTLTQLQRDDMITLEGKKRLLNEMIKRLNIWLSTGKVNRAYFSKFIIG